MCTDLFKHIDGKGWGGGGFIVQPRGFTTCNNQATDWRNVFYYKELMIGREYIRHSALYKFVPRMTSS